MTDQQEVLTLKQEVADEYLKKFKDELWFLKSLAILPIENKIKDILLSDQKVSGSFEDLDIGFWKYIVNVVSPTTAEQIFTFLKEKQELLVSNHTKEELQHLHNQILGIPDAPSTSASANSSVNNSNSSSNTDTPHNAVVDWVVVAGIWTTGIVWASTIEKMAKGKKLSEVINPKETQQLLNQLADDFARKAENPKIPNFMKKNFKKSAEIFRDGAKLDKETVHALEVRQKLESKLPFSVLKKWLNIPKSTAKLLQGLDKTALEELARIKDMSKVRTFLESKWIIGLSDEVIRAFSLSWQVGDVEWLISICAASSKIVSLGKALKCVGIIDALALWFSAWALMENKNEAQEMAKINALRADVHRQKGNIQFWAVDVWSTAAIALITTCTMIGSIAPGIGTAIGFAVWVAAYGASELIAAYYAKKEFYAQNEIELRNQYRTEVKQALVQAISSENNGFDVSLKKQVEYEKGRPLTTIEDAWRALIWQEWLENWEYSLIQQQQAQHLSDEEFKKTLDAQQLTLYTQQTEKLSSLVDLRLSYIKQQQVSPDFASIEQILADSQTFACMKDTSSDQYISGCSTISEYQQKYKERLMQDDAAWFSALETLYAQNPSRFESIYQWSNYYEQILSASKDDTSLKDSYDILHQNISFLHHYAQRKHFGQGIEYSNSFTLAYDNTHSDIDLNYLESFLKTWKTDTIPSYTEDQMKSYFISNALEDRLASDFEVADSIGQNVLYRVAREFHGYSGHNDMNALMQYFQSGKENALWLYYDKWWYINNDWAIDKDIDLHYIESHSVQETINHWRISDALVTATGHEDESLNTAFWTRFEKILDEEKSYKNPDHCAQIQQEVIDYISQAAGSFVELPVDLVVKAKKVGLWDVNKFLFSFQQGRLIAYTGAGWSTEQLHFTWIPVDISYVGGNLTTGASVVQETQQDKNVSATFAAVQDMIEHRDPRIILPNRGKIHFDAQTKELISRWWSRKIDITGLKIEWLSLQFNTIKELLIAANFLNRCKHTYPDVKDFYTGSMMGIDYGIYRSESWLDTQIWDVDTIKEICPSLLDSNNDVYQSFVNCMNTL